MNGLKNCVDGKFDSENGFLRFFSQNQAIYKGKTPSYT